MQSLLVKLQFGQSRVDEEAMEHVGLLVIMRGKNDIVHNVLKSLNIRER